MHCITIKTIGVLSFHSKMNPFQQLQAVKLEIEQLYTLLDIDDMELKPSQISEKQTFILSQRKN